MIYYVCVGIAGMVGALLRYYTGHFINTGWTYPFPLDTLVVNWVGCFALSWLTFSTTNNSRMPDWLKVALSTGLLGSFTTFSAFSVETIELIRNELWRTALAYSLLSLWGGIVLVQLGARISSRKS